MNWTNNDEKIILREWAEKNYSLKKKKEIFSDSDKSLETYFSVIDESIYDNLIEYDFLSKDEILPIIENNFSYECHKEILLPLVVAMLKGKTKLLDSKSNDVLEPNAANDTYTVSEFVYEF